MNQPNEFGIYQTFADATIDVKINSQQESILKTAYKTGNNTINQTLLDFLR